MSTEEETKAVEEPKTEETKAEVAGEDAAPEEHENTTYYEPVVSQIGTRVTRWRRTAALAHI
jgi:hypothetical protein